MRLIVRAAMRTTMRMRMSVRSMAACVLAAHVASAVAAPACTLPGANVAGAEFNAGRLPGVAFRDYVYPGPAEIALLQRLGLRLMRVPVLWERLQPQPSGELDADEAKRLDDVVALAKAAGIKVAIDVHNYGAYRGTALDRKESPPDLLPDLWRRLARRYQRDGDVVFGLMNEPHDIDAAAWARIAEATLVAIRSTGAGNVVLVPGTRWDGAHSWFDGAGGTSNADALLPLASGHGPVVFEVHQYFDDNFSGTAQTCGGAGRVPPALWQMARWAREHHVRLMLGEFGVSQRPECVKALDDALAIVEKDRDVWYGWTYWAAGAWWGSYPFNIQVADGPSPQGAVLQARAAKLDIARCEASAR